MFNDKSILITGGTGSFGQKFVKTILQNFRPRRVIVYSRDEWKQSEMKMDEDFANTQVRFFLVMLGIKIDYVLPCVGLTLWSMRLP